MTALPEASLDRVLRRVDAIWGPDAAPHHLVYGQTGSGKTTLIKALLSLCPYERVLILDPKPHADPVWDGQAEDPHRWGAPVAAVPGRFGFEGDRGGGPHGLWYRLVGSPDRRDTARRFAGALATVAAEGHCVLVLDDVREICRQMRLAEHVDSVMNLGRSANMLAILAATETGYVSGRAQAAMTWIGHTSGLDTAKAGAALLGRSGRAWYETTGAVEPHQWIYADSQPGSAGLVLTALREVGRLLARCPRAATTSRERPVSARVDYSGSFLRHQGSGKGLSRAALAGNLPPNLGPNAPRLPSSEPIWNTDLFCS